MQSSALYASLMAALSLPLSSALATPDVAGPASAYWPFQKYQTVDFNPPVFEITTSGAPLAPGYLFFGQGTSNATAADNGGTRQTSPLIMTDTGELVWSGPRGSFANNLKVDTLHGEPVLSYWAGIELVSTDLPGSLKNTPSDAQDIGRPRYWALLWCNSHSGLQLPAD